MKNDIFSVLIPTYNRANSLISTLNSVKEQTYRPIELVIVDDGSTDHTKEVVQKWQSDNQSEDFTILYHYKENGGVSSARNLALALSSGFFIQYLDSDDTIFPKRLETLKNAFLTHQADFIQTGFQGIDEHTGEIVQKSYGREGQNMVNLAFRGLLGANTLRASLTRELAIQVGNWNEEMTCFEDRLYMERAVIMAKMPISIREILATATRTGDDRISNKLTSYEGRKWRIFCEAQLVQMSTILPNIPKNVFQEFKSRLFGLKLRSISMGWKDHAHQCDILANKVIAQLNTKGKIRKNVAKLGQNGAKLYLMVGGMKRNILNK
jgi:glycosyltransferase involved in cell wall biosynthesis